MRKMIYLLAVISLSACGNKNELMSNENDERRVPILEVTKAQFETMGMEIAPIGVHDFKSIVSATGKIDVPPQNKARVTSFVDGYVKKIHLQVGENVRKGQALITLVSPEFLELQQSYLETKAQISYLESEYERQQTLYKENISSQKKYLEAESNFKTAKARLNSVMQRLVQLNVDLSLVDKGKFTSDLTIYAPIAGDVANLNVNIGMAVSKADELIELINSNNILLQLSVFEKDALNISEGQSIEFNIPQSKEQKFRAVVSKIGKSIQGSDRVIAVQAKIEDVEKSQFIVGMMVDAQIITNTKQYLSIPEDALVSEEDSHSVLVFESEKESAYSFTILPVELGSRNGDMVEVRTNKVIKEGVKILMKGTYDVM